MNVVVVDAVVMEMSHDDDHYYYSFWNGNGRVVDDVVVAL